MIIDTATVINAESTSTTNQQLTQAQVNQVRAETLAARTNFRAEDDLVANEINWILDTTSSSLTPYVWDGTNWNAY